MPSVKVRRLPSRSQKPRTVSAWAVGISRKSASRVGTRMADLRWVYEGRLERRVPIHSTQNKSRRGHQTRVLVRPPFALCSLLLKAAPGDPVDQFERAGIAGTQRPTPRWTG